MSILVIIYMPVGGGGSRYSIPKAEEVGPQSAKGVGSRVAMGSVSKM